MGYLSCRGQYFAHKKKKKRQRQRTLPNSPVGGIRHIHAHKIHLTVSYYRKIKPSLNNRPFLKIYYTIPEMSLRAKKKDQVQ